MSEGCECSIRSRSRNMYDLTVAGKPSDVCDVLHASHRDTYICMYERAYVPVADHACVRSRAISENSPLRSLEHRIYSPPRSNYNFAMYRYFITKMRLGCNEKSRIHEDVSRKMEIQCQVLSKASNFQFAFDSSKI